MIGKKHLAVWLVALLMASGAAAQGGVRPLPFTDDFEQYNYPYHDSVWPWTPMCYYTFGGWESCGRGMYAVFPTEHYHHHSSNNMSLCMNNNTIDPPIHSFYADTMEGVGWGTLAVTPWLDTVPGVVSFDALAYAEVEWWGVRQDYPWMFLQVGTVSGPLPDTTIIHDQIFIGGAGNPACGCNFVPWVTLALPNSKSMATQTWPRYRVDLRGLFEGQAPPYRVAFYTVQTDSTLYLDTLIPTNYGPWTRAYYRRQAQLWLDDVRIDPAGVVAYDTVQHVDTVCQGSYYVNYGFALDHHATADTGTHHFEHTEVLTADGSQQRVHLLELTVLASEVGVQTVYLVQGDTLWWHGEALTRDTVCQQDAAPANGCRLVTLQLFVVPPHDTVHRHDTVYAGSRYEWRGVIVDPVAAGDQVYTLDTVFDSVQTTLIVHLQGVQARLTASSTVICQGDTVALAEGAALGGMWRCRPDTPWLYADGATALCQPWQTTTCIFADSSGRPLDSVTVTVLGTPQVQLALNRDYIDFDYPVVTLEDLTEGSVQSRWLFSDGVTLTGRQVRRQFRRPLPDSLTVRLITCNAAGCCADTLLTLPTVTRSVWFPNAFTPGADSDNRFGVVTNCSVAVFSLTVYNRRGMVVFESSDPALGWDGTRKGAPLPQGAYVYRWFLEDSSGFRYSGTGTVTLLR